MGASTRKDYVGTTSALRITLATVVAGDTVLINGLLYTGVTGIKSDATEFSVDTSDDAAAIDLAASINADVRPGTIETNSTLVAVATDNVLNLTADSATPQLISAYSSGARIRLTGEYFNVLSLSSDVADNNPTFKQVNFMNTPFSVQSSGADKEVDVKSVPRLIQIDDDTKFNALTVRDRILNGNKEGWVSAIVADTSVTFTYFDQEKVEVDTVITIDEALASGNLFFLTENY